LLDEAAVEVEDGVTESPLPPLPPSSPRWAKIGIAVRKTVKMTQAPKLSFLISSS
jgi:hypothetical protein